MQIHELFVEDVDHGARCFSEPEQLFLRQEICVVSTVNGLSNSIDGMGRSLPAAKTGSVLDIIDACLHQLLFLFQASLSLNVQ